MLLTTLKWLTWLSALGLIVFVWLVILLRGSIGLIELIITFLFAGLVSLPGWVIHFLQKRQKIV